MLKSWIAKKLRYAFGICSKGLYEEAHATKLLAQLSPLIAGWSYLPLTDWAAGPEYYAHICNDMIVNNKKNVVEVGSGISTILLARLIKKNNLATKVISIDHDANWQAIVAQCLENDGIREFVEFVSSPLVQQGGYLWYDRSRIGLPKDFVADTIIVDGPIGNVAMARYGALPYLKEYLSNDCYTIYLHDTDRFDEQEVINRWVKMLPGAEIDIRLRYTVIRYGTKFCFSPQRVT